MTDVIDPIELEPTGSPMLPIEIMAGLNKRLVRVATGESEFLSIRKGYAAEIEKDGADNGKLAFVISTEAIDRMGDIIEVGGWQTENYLRNPIVLFGHEYGEVAGSPPSQGRTLSLTKTRRNGARALTAVVEFHRVTRFNNELYAMYKGGFMNTTSVGFWPTAQPEPIKSDAGDVTGFRFIKQDLLEWSLVAVPANPEAVQEAMKKGIIRPRTAEFLSAVAGGSADRAPFGAVDERIEAESRKRLEALRLKLLCGRIQTEAAKWNQRI